MDVRLVLTPEKYAALCKVVTDETGPCWAHFRDASPQGKPVVEIIDARHKVAGKPDLQVDLRIHERVTFNTMKKEGWRRITTSLPFTSIFESLGIFPFEIPEELRDEINNEAGLIEGYTRQLQRYLDTSQHDLCENIYRLVATIQARIVPKHR